MKKYPTLQDDHAPFIVCHSDRLTALQFRKSRCFALPTNLAANFCLLNDVLQTQASDRKERERGGGWLVRLHILDAPSNGRREQLHHPLEVRLLVEQFSTY